jgi:hypothetical protein
MPKLGSELTVPDRKPNRKPLRSLREIPFDVRLRSSHWFAQIPRNTGARSTWPFLPLSTAPPRESHKGLCGSGVSAPPVPTPDDCRAKRMCTTLAVPIATCRCPGRLAARKCEPCLPVRRHVRTPHLQKLRSLTSALRPDLQQSCSNTSLAVRHPITMAPAGYNSSTKRCHLTSTSDSIPRILQTAEAVCARITL